MAKIRLTKNELKKQKDNLARFTRYLPTLELKKQQLLVEIRRIQAAVERFGEESRRVERKILPWAAVFSGGVDLAPLIRVSEIRESEGNIAGIAIPVLEDVLFEEPEVDLMETPLWVDQALPVVFGQIRRRLESEFAERQQHILREELRVTVQRIKLFEEVKIPEARENIRVIQIFMGDQQTAAVVRGKIAKTKIQKKRMMAGRT
ncbi:V-type ATP synthase subunit D [bacterium]|nr:V-type ATP synthase subunit D [bacterium]